MEPTAVEAMSAGRGGKRANNGRARKSPGRRTALIAAGATVGVCAAAYLGLCAYAGSRDTFYADTTINGVDVSGLTASAAQEQLRQQLPQQKVALYDGAAGADSTPLMQVSLADLGFDASTVTASDGTPFSDWASNTMDSTRDTNFLTAGWTFLKDLAGHPVLDWYSYTLSGETLHNMAESIVSQLSQDAIDSSFTVESDRISIVKAKDGRTLDVDALQTQLQTAGNSSDGVALSFVSVPAQSLTAQEVYDEAASDMKNAGYDASTGSIIPEQVGAKFDVADAQAQLDVAQPGSTVEVPATMEYPKVTASDLKGVLFRDVLGECSTHVGGSSARISNVKLAASAINGKVLNCGDVFSYNGATGQRTAAKGYQAAPAYVQGETVDEIGGGVCQPSSTLYLACLRANMQITERYAHRYAPSYVPKGMDATVSWGGPDYKFTNNTDYPVKISATYSNGYLTVKLLGTNVSGNYVEMTNEQLSTTPWETVYQDDPTLPVGTEKVKTTPYTGYKYKTYRNLYSANGTLLSSTYEATSDYKVRNKVVLRGTKAVSSNLPASSSTETPASTPSTPSTSTPSTSTPAETTPSTPTETTPSTPETPAETPAAPDPTENLPIIVLPSAEE